MTVVLDREGTSLQRFGAADQKTDFTPEHIAVESSMAVSWAERHNPREPFIGHSFTTPWDPLQRAYFNGLHCGPI
jgi:hypothetical protein